MQELISLEKTFLDCFSLICIALFSQFSSSMFFLPTPRSEFLAVLEVKFSAAVERCLL